jgi:hypothetical protein
VERRRATGEAEPEPKTQNQRLVAYGLTLFGERTEKEEKLGLDELEKIRKAQATRRRIRVD